MLFRSFAVLCLALALSASAWAQFGKPKPTPKNADEYFAERAMRDASRMTEGVLGREVIKETDGVNLARAESRMEEAFEIFDRMCNDRTLPRDQWARNCFSLADMHRRGLGTPQDYAKAKTIYDATCLQGRHAASCNQQAYISQLGTGGTVDLEHARSLYNRSCDLQDPGGCSGLGNMMYMGLGGARDRSRAVSLLQGACADEYEWACTRLVEYGIPERIDRY